MAEYQNIFNRVQVHGPADPGVPLYGDQWRIIKPKIWRLLGLIGDAQVGPFYLGMTGLASLVCGFIAIKIIGLNMLASELELFRVHTPAALACARAAGAGAWPKPAAAQ